MPEFGPDAQGGPSPVAVAFLARRRRKLFTQDESAKRGLSARFEGSRSKLKPLEGKRRSVVRQKKMWSLTVIVSAFAVLGMLFVAIYYLTE